MLTVNLLFVNGITTIITIGIIRMFLRIVKDATGSRPTGAIVTHKTNNSVSPLVPPAGGEFRDVDDRRVGVVEFPSHCAVCLDDDGRQTGLPRQSGSSRALI